MGFLIVGKDTKNFKKVKCKNCNSKLKYSADAERVETFINYDYDNNIYINCPNCNKKVYVSW